MIKRVYLAGSFSDQSNWRDEFNLKLKTKFKGKVLGIDPFRRKLEESNPDAKIGHDIFCVKNSDFLVVNAINSQVTMGTSQEIILAKYFNKPVIMVIDKNSGIKFEQRTSHTGNVIKNYIHPFANNFCDSIVENYDDAINEIENFLSAKKIAKSFKDTLQTEERYKKKILPTDTITQELFNQTK